jgi:hypothetical protein
MTKVEYSEQSISGETYLPQFKLYVSGFDTSPFGIEWMRFEPDSPIDELIKRSSPSGHRSG